MDKLKLHTPDVTAANIEKIAALFPNCLTEARDDKGVLMRKIDFDQLRQELSDQIVDGPRERYHLDWPGKREALIAANAPTTKTLRPVKAESVNFNATKNLFIEGDNLDALKLLQETYLGKVSFIYIDPPYNTGNDFIYEDDFCESTSEFTKRSMQVSEIGERLVPNPETNGRFHSDWLSMLYPRLRLARNLLTDNGFLAISISDDELATLRLIMDEIMGPKSFVECFTWESIFRPSNMSKRTRKNAEYVILYIKDPTSDFELVERLQDAQGDASLTQNNNKPRTLIFPEGSLLCTIPDGTYPAGKIGEIALEKPLIVYAGKNRSQLVATGKFKWSQEYLDSEIEKGVTLKIKSESLIPYYRKDYQQTVLRPTKILPSDLVEDVLAANAEVAELLGEQAFDYPKPTSLIAFFIRALRLPKDAIILDFFAGSGTTGDAVIRVNAADTAARRYVLVQLPEPVERAGYKTIAEITKERLRRAGKKIKGENATSAVRPT